MKRFCFLLPVSIALLPLAHAEETMTLEEKKASIVTLEQHIAQREARLAEWGQEIMSLDHRIESQVDELVTLIAGLKDSNDSRRKVNQIKKDAIEGLKKGIDNYRAKRRQVAELIRTGETSALGDLDKLDDRILKRIDQIATITKSIPTNQDAEKYESYGSSYWNGYHVENQRVTDEWRQERRDMSASNLQRKHTDELIEDALASLDQRRRTLEDSVKNRKLQPSEMELYQRDLGKIDAYEDHLRKQQRSVVTSTTGGGKPIGMDQAQDIMHMIEDARVDLREDVSDLFRKYDQFIKGRSYIESLKANLEARKKWMAENAPGE